MKEESPTAPEGLLSGLLESAHCFQCRRCCIFYPDEQGAAPRFTDTSHAQLLQDFPHLDLHFHPHGALWQIEGLPIPGDPAGRVVCPFYDLTTARCAIYASRPFDCIVWPFYLLRRDGEVSAAFSTFCEPVTALPRTRLLELLQGPLGRYLVEEVRRWPDLIVEDRDEGRTLLALSDLPGDKGVF